MVLFFMFIDPFDCSNDSICHLAWLTRYKDSGKIGARCSNGTSFKDLQSVGFNHCGKSEIRGFFLKSY